MDLKFIVALRLYRKFKQTYHDFRRTFRHHFWVVFFTYTAVTTGFLDLDTANPDFGNRFGAISALFCVTAVSWLVYFHKLVFFRDFHDLKIIVHGLRNPWSRLRYLTRYSAGSYDYDPRKITLVECTVANIGGFAIRASDVKDNCLQLVYEDATLILMKAAGEYAVGHDPSSHTIYLKDFKIDARHALSFEVMFDRRPKIISGGVLENGAPILVEYQASPVGEISGGIIMFLMMMSVGGGLFLLIRAGDSVLQLVRTLNNWRVSFSLLGLALSDLSFLWLLIHSSFYFWREHPYMETKH